MRYLFLKLLPKNLISRLVGVLTDLKIPTPFLLSIIQIYCMVYKVNLEEMEAYPNQLRTFNDFFTRKLKPGARPIDEEVGSIISPVDGTISEFGAINKGFLTQTKGILYSLNDLIGKKDSKLFEDGFFITIYLSPADYHRIHSPINGVVKNFSYFSGNLWPVNNFGVKQIGGLFAINERIFTPLRYGKNNVAGVVKVGATIVGKISLDYNNLTTNSKKANQIYLPIIPEKKYQKGDEIGKFMMGSTVILLFQKDQFISKEINSGQKLKMGEAIGSLKESK